MKIPVVGAVRPRALRRGDRIAVLAPSGSAAARYPARLERGLAALRSAGFEPVVMPHARCDRGWVSSSAAERLADLHAAFADASIAGVMTTVGGRGAAQLLDGLDYDLVAASPKVFCGYSDTTALHVAIGLECRLVTFYGPSVMAEFAEWPAVRGETAAWWSKAVTDAAPLGALPTFGQIATGTTDWSSAERRLWADAPCARVLRTGTGQGPIAGGCLPVLCELVGTPWCPDLSGAIAVIETPGDAYHAGQALSDLTQLRNAGLLSRLSGLVVGWPGDLAQVDDLAAIVAQATAGTSYPILLGVPVGHTHPKLTIPLGCAARLDGDRLTILEGGVAPP